MAAAQRSSTDVATVLEKLSAAVGELRAEVGQLRLAVTRRTGAEPGPVVQPQVTTPGAETYEMDPAHDAEVIKAYCAGDLDAAKLAYRAARDRLSASPGRPGQPATVGELQLSDSRRQRRGQAEAQRRLDLAGAPIHPGGVIERHPGGQATVRYAAQPSCPQGHAGERGKPFCPVCGDRMAALQLGEQWDEASQLAAQREREESSERWLQE
jgi:hypothetical protein